MHVAIEQWTVHRAAYGDAVERWAIVIEHENGEGIRRSRGDGAGIGWSPILHYETRDEALLACKRSGWEVVEREG